MSDLCGQMFLHGVDDHYSTKGSLVIQHKFDGIIVINWEKVARMSVSDSNDLGVEREKEVVTAGN